MCEAPVPYVKGGTWVGIYDGSQNKDLAWLFLQYCTLNEESVKAYASEYASTSHSRAGTKRLLRSRATPSSADRISTSSTTGYGKDPRDLMTQYDGNTQQAFLSAVKSYVSGAMTKDEAIAQFKATR
jgi:hypothetical protein